MSERLKGKIGIVTGAGTGIERACGIALAREGAQVALVGRRRNHVEEVTHEIGDSAFAVPADVSRTNEIEHLLDQTVRRFGGLNFLLNNAGVLHIGSAADYRRTVGPHLQCERSCSSAALSSRVTPHEKSWRRFDY